MSIRGTHGTPGVSLETWQFGLRLSTPSAGYDVAAQEGDMADDVQAYFANSDAKFAAITILREVRFSDIGTDGLQNGVTRVYPRVQGGASGSSDLHPWQCTVCVSLVADGRGKGYKGRVFLPAQTLALDAASGLMTTANQTQIATSFQAFINDLNNHAGPDLAGTFDVIIVGHTGVAGTARRVDKIRVGRVIDTQRRRRRQLPEQYTELPVSA